MQLEDALAQAFTDTGGAFAVGQVTAVGTRITVTVRGGTKTISRLAAYSAPAVGDVVLIACAKQSWCALGKII